MKISELLEMAKMKYSAAPMGLSQYETDEYFLAGGMRSGNSSAGTTRLKYIIFDRKIFEETGDQEKANIGYVELFVEDESGEIIGLVNILLKPKFRKSGHGKRIIRDIVDTTERGLTVHDIQKKARRFWEKVGVEYDTRSKTSGKIIK